MSKTALKECEHVIFVDIDVAHDALVGKLNEDGTIHLLYLEMKPNPQVTMKYNIPHRSETKEKPYFWIPGGEN